MHGAEIRTKSLPLFGVSKSVNHPGAHAAVTDRTTRQIHRHGSGLQKSRRSKARHGYEAHEGLLLVDAEVSRGADASRGQGLENNRRVQAGKPRSSHIWLDVDTAESQLGCLTHGLHGKYFLPAEINGKHDK